MNLLEDLVQRSASAGLFDINDPSLITTCLVAIGNILPDDGAPTAAAPIGRSVGMQAYSMVSPLEELTYEYQTVRASDEELIASQVLSTINGRQPQNHPLPFRNERVIDKCESAYCDMIWLLCIHQDGRRTLKFMCCDAPNPATFCDNPPCWFFGNRCPDTGTGSLESPSASAAALAASRRLKALENMTSAADTLLFGEITTTIPTPAPISGAGALLVNLENSEIPVLNDVRVAIQRQEIETAARLRASAQMEAVGRGITALGLSKLRQV
eukprot:s3530_g13.t1